MDVKDIIIANFPMNYKQMCYLEPFGNNAKFLLLKNKSEQEVYNDFEENNLLKTFRDNPKKLSFPNKIARNKSSVKKIYDRIQDVFILNQKPKDIIPWFNNKDTFIFCEIPNKFPAEQYEKLAELLNNSFSNIIVMGNIVPKLFKEWKKIKTSSLILKNYK